MKGQFLSWRILLSAALAQDTALPDWFRKIDQNGDGHVSREEMPKLFDRIDTDRDGIA